jgi:hypothetical protein
MKKYAPLSDLNSRLSGCRNFSQIVQMRKIYEEDLSKIYAAKKKGK